MNQDVSKHLYSWLTSEMGYPGDDITAEDLRSICKGPMVDIWSHVMKHVKSRDTAAKMRKNLTLHGKSLASVQDEKRATLLASRRKLQTEVDVLKKSVTVLQDENKDERNLLLEQEQELHYLNHCIRDLKRVMYLLKLEYQSLRHKLNKQQHEAERLTELVKLFDSSAGDQSTDLRCEIEQICKDVESIPRSLTEQGEHQTSQLREKKAEFGQNVADILIANSRLSLGRCIVQFQEESLQNLATSSNATEERDEETVPDTLEPLQKLLQQLCWTYVMLQTASRKAQNQAANLSKELELKERSTTHVLEEYTRSKPLLLAPACSLVQLRQQLARRKAAVEYLKKAVEELEQYCDLNQAKQTEIDAKLREIEANRTKADHVAGLICTLVRRNGAALKAIADSCGSAKARARIQLKDKHEKLCTALEMGKPAYGQQIQVLTSLQPSRFFQAKVNENAVPLDQLSMHRLLPQRTDAGDLARENLKSALSILELEPILPVHVVLQAVRAKCADYLRMQQLIRLWQNYSKSKNLSNKWTDDSLVICSELKKEVEDKRNKQQKELVPVLDSRIKQLSTGQRDLKELRKLYDEWWNEPAQYLDIGTRVADVTLPQWREEWAKSLAAIRKVKK